MSGRAELAATRLMRLYLEGRDDFVRFFALRTGSAAEAEDIVQELYLKIAGIDDRGIANPAAFLYRLGSNIMLDRHRARRRSLARDDAYYRIHRHGAENGEDEAGAPSLEAAAAGKQTFEALLKAIDRLPAQCRNVFILQKLEGRTHAEIAAKLGISRSAVEKHMISALKRLSEWKP